VTNHCASNSKPRRIFLGLSVLCVAAALAGCGARKPVAASQPAATQPSSTPEGTTTTATNSTVTPLPPSKKRSKDGAIPVAPGYTEEGEASWYGAPFHGRQASNGEIYDMNKLTAAHRTLPFETMVRVTNQRNGKSAIVRITDRGPFVNNRIIDLSYAAARQIESIGPGVVPVRVEVLSTGSDPEAGFFTIQVGSFREQANAERLRARLAPSYSPIFIKRYGEGDKAFYRVHVGKVSGEEAAEKFGEELRMREGVVPMVIRLDESTPNAGEVQ
jgi:rare lipoprotein A